MILCLKSRIGFKGFNNRTTGNVLSWSTGPELWVWCCRAGLQCSAALFLTPVCVQPVYTLEHSVVALDSPFLRASHFAVSLPHLHRTINNRQGGGGRGFIVCLQDLAQQLKVTQPSGVWATLISVQYDHK